MADTDVVGGLETVAGASERLRFLPLAKTDVIPCFCLSEVSLQYILRLLVLQWPDKLQIILSDTHACNNTLIAVALIEWLV